jgi:hypothetical protein
MWVGLGRLSAAPLSFLRLLLQHGRPLPDRQFDPWPMSDRFIEYLARLIEIAAGVQHAIDLGAVLRPFFDL